MSFVVDDYFPFDSGTGAGATDARWRKMARGFMASGVLASPGQLQPSIAAGVITIQPGAAWVDGYYGEITAAKTFTAPADGLVVMALNHVSKQVSLTLNTGVNLSPVQAFGGDTWEVPIARIVASALTDIRQFSSTEPAGIMSDYGGTTPPLGWLLCNGALYRRIDYPNLFSAIGTVWGAAGLGTGAPDSTHFSVPDSQGRVALGTGAGAGLTARTLASSSGSESHVLAASELAAHNHGVNDPQHNHTINSPGHSHGIDGDTGLRFAFSKSISTRYLSMTATDSPTTFSSMNSAVTGDTATSNNTGISTANNAGTGAALALMQPFTGVTKIIKT